MMMHGITNPKLLTLFGADYYFVLQLVVAEFS
jgi:hypothetical protein